MEIAEGKKTVAGPRTPLGGSDLVPSNEKLEIGFKSRRGKAGNYVKQKSLA